MGDDHRRQGVARTSDDFDAPPDPFEDLAAPPLRTTPPPVRPAPRPSRAAAAPAAAPVEPPAAADADLPIEIVAPSPDVERSPAAPPKPAVAPAPRVAAPAMRPSGMRQLRAAALAALVVAAGIVALAVAFRPAAEAPAEAPTELGSGPVPEPAPAAEAAATHVSGARVEMRLEAGTPESRRAALEAAVTAAGYGGLSIAGASGPVDRGRIEFYHPADRAAAEALARSLAPLTGGPLGVHDMSGVTLGAAPGRIAVWIAS